MKLFFTFCFIALYGLSYSQTYGNEWINYNQKYYSFKIYEDGLYKIDYETLQANGITPSQFSTSNMQLFGKDKEQAIYVVDGGDNQMNPGDYFLFYAQKNDGWLDSTLFRNSQDIGNPGQSMFNDTIHYFFTWNTSNNNLRFVYESYEGYTNFVKSEYVIDQFVYSPTGAYNPGKVSNIDPSSLFDPGEGFHGGFQNGGVTSTTLDINIDLNNIYTGTNPPAPLANLQCKASSYSNASFNLSDEYNHHLKFSMGNTTLLDKYYLGYEHTVFETSLAADFLANNTLFKFEILNDLGVATDYQSLNYLSLNYAKTPKLNGALSDRFKIINNNFGSKIKIEITNSSIQTPIVIILGPKPKFINTLKSNDTIYTLVTNSISGENQDLVIQDISLLKIISTIEAVNGNGVFTNFSSTNFEAANLIITHPKFNQNNGNSQYVAYRQQTYNVVEANIEELYLQFGGGIEKHSNAIRRFAHYAYNHSTEKPIAITILGKGLRNDITKNNSGNFANSLIPPFGSPGSDIYYTSFLGINNYTPLIPIGRISVTTEQDLKDYLNKLIEYEEEQNQSDTYTHESKEWQKQILHFIGGSDYNQVLLFKSYMDGFKNTIEDTLFGGNVTSFLKYTGDPLDPSLISEISNYIESGASILNFFGHSGSIGFDISVDDPALWNNNKKYPIIIGNGCHAAAIYDTPYEYAFSEKIIETANNGGIAYLASGAQEYDVTLRDYCSELYKQISYKNYGQHFGKQIIESIKAIEPFLDESSYSLQRFHSTFGATNLNGDPLLKANYHNNPEIVLREQDITFNPANINLDVDTLDVKIILTNLGRSVKDTFELAITRNFPLSQIDSNYSINIPKLNYRDTISLKIPLQPNISIGINNFNFRADIPSFITENYEEFDNNTVNKIFYLKVDGILPILPYEYAVVPNDTTNVFASTIDPIAGNKTYFFELDTTDLFNSQQLRKKTVVGSGGVKSVKWDEWLNANGTLFPLQNTPQFNLDSVVFFWRVAVDSSTIVWNESSFQHIKGKEGWGQDHFYQYKNNSIYNIKLNRDNRRREFDPVTATLSINVDNNNPNNNWWGFVGMAESGEYGTCFIDPSIHLAVINPNNLEWWKTNCSNPSGYALGQTNQDCVCRNRSESYFIFRQDQQGLSTLFDVLTNQIPPDYYVILYSVYQLRVDTIQLYAPQLLTWFQQHGSNLINPNINDNSYIFFTQLNNSSLTQEVLANDPNQIINLTFDITGADDIGTEKSTIIGPALEWKTVYWKQYPLETTIGDTTILKITGLNFTTNTSVELQREFTLNDSIINFNEIIDAGVYPYLKLEAIYRDTMTATPAQIDRWHVLYSPVPEAAIDNTNAYTLSPVYDTIKEGQEFIFAADYKNISTIHMDSMLVKYWIEDANHVNHFLNYPRQDSLRVSQSFRDTITVNTTGFPGLNSLWMEINPYINYSSTQTDQPEQHHFNNLLQIPFFVKGDDINPILDVTFDGRHILNGDIVNPKSEIVISLKDENPFLVMNDISDTTLFGVFLTYPNGVQKRIPFIDQNGNTILQVIPAEEKNKKFKIIYNGNFTTDGIYKLIVQGADRSGNLSGDTEYKINFEVINESTITYLMNYPNPFSTSTKFVFTLTGTKVPEDIIIQILTVTGKVVREITEDELGPIYIGRNVTQYSWNGTDEFGDALANGVYLYRVLSQLDGEKIKHRDSGADKYFKKEFGKMYLMR